MKFLYKQIALPLSTARMILSISVFMIVVLVLGFPYPFIGFDSDAFGKVFSCLHQRCSLHIFFDSINTCYHPLNAPLYSPHFLTLYRPLEHLVFYLCCSLFGTFAYGYFLVSILFHAWVSAVIFYLYSHLFDLFIAWLLALLFAFFPAHYPSFIGLVCAINPVYFFLSCSLLFFIFYKKQNTLYWYIGSANFYFLALFSYELPIVFPVILLLYCILFERARALKDTILFFCATGLYLVLRYICLRNGSASLLLQTLNRWKTLYIQNWVKVIKPFLGMQSVSKYAVIAGVVIGVLLLLLYMIFNKSHRKLVSFYIIAFLMASWPLTGDGASRYFYAAIPFFLLIIMELIVFCAQKLPTDIRYFFVVVVLILGIGWGTVRAWQNLHAMQECTLKRDEAFEYLAQRYGNKKNVKLIFLGTLSYARDLGYLMGSGVTQAARLFFKKPSLLAYHVHEARIYCKGEPKKTMTIIPVAQGYRFISTDPEYFFHVDLPENTQDLHSMGILKVHKKISHWQATDISFIFDKKWLNDIGNTIFVTWDPVHWCFVELNKKHLA